MAKALYLVFTDTADKDFTLRLPECREDLTAIEVATAMDDILDTAAVTSTSGGLVAKKEAYTIDTVKAAVAIA